MFKVHPPLRTDADVAAVKAGLADGTIDAIATDHAPHAPHLKEQAFDQAPPGMLGLETALALALTELDLPIERILALLSWQPAAIAGLVDRHGGPIEPGRPANLCVIDPAHEWVVEPSALASRARNTPYAGRRLTGQGPPHAARWRGRRARRRGAAVTGRPRTSSLVHGHALRAAWPCSVPATVLARHRAGERDDLAPEASGGGRGAA